MIEDSFCCMHNTLYQERDKTDKTNKPKFDYLDSNCLSNYLLNNTKLTKILINKMSLPVELSKSYVTFSLWADTIDMQPYRIYIRTSLNYIPVIFLFVIVVFFL